ncbi:MurR/RpiR family transcriptional regulator [Allofustis seminis]|uniref:MurR/RpiR family transcriptional regulator n=1 Tax=Allofustis seminis TaxID=166939 RepID=UPI000360F451|nr:MurR/RpiR family transcriptional regulator [Allofustis seminis]
MNALIKQLTNKRKALTDLENKVLDYILNNSEEALNLSIEEIAQRTYCSTATISRMCKKIGYSGFIEFKLELAKNNRSLRQKEETYNSKENHVEYLDQVYTELGKNVKNILHINFEQLLTLLSNRKRVEFFGVGRSFSVCQEGARKLTFAGCLSYARSDWDEQRAVARYMMHNDLAILISMSGETLHILECASILSQSEVPTLAFIGSKRSSLEKMVDHSIVLDIDNTRYHNIDISSHFLFSIIVDILSMKYLALQEK